MRLRQLVQGALSKLLPEGATKPPLRDGGLSGSESKRLAKMAAHDRRSKLRAARRRLFAIASKIALRQTLWASLDKRNDRAERRHLLRNVEEVRHVVHLPHLRRDGASQPPAR
eukprot:1773634-Pleurochrysis_carterae.AAC.1